MLGAAEARALGCRVWGLGFGVFRAQHDTIATTGRQWSRMCGRCAKGERLALQGFGSGCKNYGSELGREPDGKDNRT